MTAESSEALRAFVADVDCAFPYFDDVRVDDILRRAEALGPPAILMVAFELVSVPASVQVPLARMRSLVAKWRAHAPIPMTQEIGELALVAARGRGLTRKRAIALLREFRRHPELAEVLPALCGVVQSWKLSEELYEEASKSWHLP